MSLLSETFAPISESENNSVPYNTDTIFDLATGQYVQGVDGKYYLLGGLGCQINSFVGQNGHFKSTMTAGLVTRSVAIYDTDLVIRDTEDSISRDKDRIYNMANDLCDGLDPASVHWISSAKHSLEDFDEWILQHCSEKAKHAKDITIETPIINPSTLKPYKQLLPTYVFVDSFTEDYSNAENSLLNDANSGKSGMGDSSANTAYMKDGNKKTLWTRTMRRRCEEYAIVLVLTGHYDQKMAMDTYHPNPKETTFGKQDWVVKGVGSKFKFLSSIYARTQAVLLQDSNKQALYCDGLTPDKDIFEVDVLIDRCKTALAGTMTPFVCSQEKGLLNAATNYNYIKLNDFWGCQGNKQKQQLNMLPDVTISRNTIRQLADSNYQLRRALQITAQLCYIRNNWNPANVGYDLKEDPKKIFDFLMSDKNKQLKEDILNSRGYWTYKKEERPYMSIYDILDKLK